MFNSGDRVSVNGQSAIFEEYSVENNKKAFVIIEPDSNADGSSLVDVRYIDSLD